jgi:hypothetical protein
MPPIQGPSLPGTSVPVLGFGSQSRGERSRIDAPPFPRRPPARLAEPVFETAKKEKSDGKDFFLSDKNCSSTGHGSLQPQRSCDQHERDGEHGEWDDVGVSRTQLQVSRSAIRLNPNYARAFKRPGLHLCEERRQRPSNCRLHRSDPPES